jgi:hypothetical protein
MLIDDKNARDNGPKTIKELFYWQDNGWLDDETLYFDYPYKLGRKGFNWHRACTIGWYDWFCKERSLFNRGKKLIKKLRQISRSKMVSLNYGFLFKNNCPCWYDETYDDFRILDDNGSVIFTVTPRVWKKDLGWHSEVWGRLNDFEEPLVVGSWWDVRKFFEV